MCIVLLWYVSSSRWGARSERHYKWVWRHTDPKKPLEAPVWRHTGPKKPLEASVWRHTEAAGTP